MNCKAMKFRKKPVVIEAIQLPQNCFQSENMGAMVNATIDFEEALAEFAPDDFRNWKWRGGKQPGVVIPTLEGEHLASPGDWIIKGVKGEFYPCKPDIFAATYEIAEGKA